MIYLNSFNLSPIDEEEHFLNSFRRTCYDSYYPFNFFTFDKQLGRIDFSDITILCGSNGSGKSTLLNIIAEKLKLYRKTTYNKTHFFDPYLEKCRYELSVHDPLQLKSLKRLSKIITSDDVFSNIIEVRERNENLNFKRELIFNEKNNINRYGGQGPRGFNTDDPQSMKAYTDYHQKRKQSGSRYVRENVGVDERTYSNGENGFKYFTDSIQPGGLYLLDEPENSLSAEMQLELVQFIIGMARFYDCQFVMSTHSPFLLSIPYAKIYDMDNSPVSVCKWTDLPSVRIYYEFFKDHDCEFNRI